LSTKLSIEIMESIEELSKVENAIDKLYEDGGLTDVNYGNVIVASTEAVLNAMNHGATMDSNQKVLFAIEITEKEIIVEVSDSGKGFDFLNLPDPTDPTNIEKGSGRGIFIMKNLSDSLEYKNNGSKVVMKFSSDTPVSLEA